MIERCCGKFPAWMTGKENITLESPQKKASSKNQYITDRYEYTPDIEVSSDKVIQHSKVHDISKWKIEKEVASRFFDESGLISYRYLSNSSIDYVRQTPTIKRIFSKDKDTGIIELVEGLLAIDPRNRLTAEKALKMSFFQKNL